MDATKVKELLIEEKYNGKVSDKQKKSLEVTIRKAKNELLSARKSDKFKTPKAKQPSSNKKTEETEDEVEEEESSEEEDVEDEEVERDEDPVVTKTVPPSLLGKRARE